MEAPDLAKMWEQIRMLADERVVILCTPSFLMILNPYEIGEPYMSYSLLTGVPHEVSA